MTRDALMHYLRDKMGVDTSSVVDDTPLFSSNLLDSFSMVDLIMFVEKEGRVRLNPTDVSLDNLDTVGRILAFVAVRRAEG